MTELHEVQLATVYVAEIRGVSHTGELKKAYGPFPPHNMYFVEVNELFIIRAAKALGYQVSKVM